MELVCYRRDGWDILIFYIVVIILMCMYGLWSVCHVSVMSEEARKGHDTS